MRDERNDRPVNQPEENAAQDAAETTRAVEPVVRHRRSMSRAEERGEEPAGQPAPAPFSRVSGRVKPAAGEAPATQTPDGRGPRQIVQAPGYTQRTPLRSAVTNGEPRVRRPQPQPQPEPEKPRKGPVVLVLVLLVLALLVLGFLLIPADDSPLGSLKRQVTDAVGGLLGREPSATANPVGTVETLDASPAQGTAPVSVRFSLTTRGQVEDVRLVDAQGSLLAENQTAARLDNTDSRVWTLEIAFNRAFTGEVHAQLLSASQWHDSPTTVALTIAAPLVPTAEVEVTPLENPGEDLPAFTGTAEPQVYALTTDVSEGEVPLTVNFSINSGLNAEDLRLVGSNGEHYPAESISHEDSETVRAWHMTVVFTEPLDDTLSVEVLHEGAWVNTYETVGIYARSAGEPAETGTWGMTDPDAVPDTERAQAEPVLTLAPTEVPPVPGTTPQPEPGEDALPVVQAATVEELTEETLLDDLPPEDMPEESAFVEAVTAETLPVEEAPVETTPAETEPVAAQTPDEEETEAAAPEPRRITVAADSSADPGKNKVADVFTGISKKAVKSYTAEAGWEMNMPGPADYLNMPFGVLTFRTSSFRQNAAFGTVEGISGMRVKWRADAGSIKGASSTYYGIGYGSQPVLIKWAKNIRDFTNMAEEKRNTSGLKEVIIAGEDGKIYFLDLADGQPTREAISVGFPLRGTPSLSPKGLPFMVTGQYARKMPGKTGKIGLRAFNLLTQKELALLDGTDNKLKRPVSELSSFNTSPLIDVNSDIMVGAGSNGLLYVTRLNTSMGAESHEFKTDLASDFLRTQDKAASTALLRVQANGEKKNHTAVESSLAAYQHYVYYADMAGWIRCVDTNDLQVKWLVSTEDAVEAAVALDLDDSGSLWLYTATTLQNRKKGDAVIRCLNAETGAERWKVSVGVAKGKNDTPTPGAKASPVIGTGELSDCVYFTLSNISAAGAETLLGEKAAQSGAVICLEKETGRVRWTYALDSYSYSSPVAVYDENGKGWIIQASSKGVLHLLDGRTGSLVSTLELEGTINGSPAVYDGTLVIGTQGKGTPYIYGIALE